MVADCDARPQDFQDSLRVSIVRNYTVETMVPLLKHHCYLAHLRPDVLVGDYDNIAQDLLDGNSNVYRHQPDIILISWLLEHLDAHCSRSDWNAEAAGRLIALALHGAISNSRALIAVSTLLPPLYSENGLAAGVYHDHRVTKVDELNRTIRRVAADHPGQVFVIDAERLIRRIGEDSAIDKRFWQMYRAPFKRAFVDHYAAHVLRIGRALKGRARKLLVLDCDNTLWGGVVGEDGLDGIVLDPHDYPGRCFVAFQQSVLNLIQHGVVVALCSKNNEQDVWEVLDRHPHCLLKREHLSAWRINWNPKADNIRELTRELNLGLDSVVFVDDSDTECELVHRQLPEVLVLQTPADPSDLPDIVVRDGLFDSLTVSKEDRERTVMYAAERSRDVAKLTATAPEEYLAALGLEADVHRASPDELARVAQLVAKTNQFNLTTRRHSEAVIRDFASSDQSAVFTLTAADKFGSLGLVGVLVARRHAEVVSIDSLLLSCRALGRSLEVFFVHRVLDELEGTWEVSEWQTSYEPTAKNGQVEQFWDRLGFTQVPSAGGGKHYLLPATSRVVPPLEFINPLSASRSRNIS